MRADARANRAKILAAARQVFGELGPDAPFDTIASRAGVGNATLYRHFSGTKSLYEAIYSMKVKEGLRAVRQLAKLEDPWTAVEGYFRWVASIADSFMLDEIFIPGSASPEIQEKWLESVTLIASMIERAQLAGVLRNNIVFDDVQTCVLAVCEVFGAPNVAAEQRDRFLRLILDGLRAQPLGPDRETASPGPSA